MVDLKTGLSAIVFGFIAILIGIILADVVADDISEFDDIISITNESIGITMTSNTVTNETINISSQAGNTTFVSVRSVEFFGNATNSTHLTDVNVSKQVNFTPAGRITLAPDQFPAKGLYNISYTYTTKGTGDTANADVTSVSFFGNATNSTHLPSIAVGTEVNFTTAGKISVDTLFFDPGTYNISYTHEGANYVSNSTARQLSDLIVLFFVIAVLMLAIPLGTRMFPEVFK